MAGNRPNTVNLIEVTDRPQSRLIDFNRIQVAPETPKKQEEFKALSLEERQQLLQKLINRVKSL